MVDRQRQERPDERPDDEFPAADPSFPGDDGFAAEDPFPEGDDPTGEPGRHTALPSKVEAWRRRSAMGAVLTGFAFGLQEALETKKQEPAIMMETSGLPPTDLPVEAELEQRPARHSVVKIRPWLLEGDDRAAEPHAAEPHAAEPHAAGPPDPTAP